MPLYKVSFTQLVPITRSVFVEDELDELDEEGIVWEAEIKLREYMEANGLETADLEDPEIESMD